MLNTVCKCTEPSSLNKLRFYKILVLHLFLIIFKYLQNDKSYLEELNLTAHNKSSSESSSLMIGETCKD